MHYLIQVVAPSRYYSVIWEMSYYILFCSVEQIESTPGLILIHLFPKHFVEFHERHLSISSSHIFIECTVYVFMIVVFLKSYFYNCCFMHNSK